MAYINPMKEGVLYRGRRILRSELCPHACRIGIGEHGRCGSRYGEEDKLIAYTRQVIVDMYGLKAALVSFLPRSQDLLDRKRRMQHEMQTLPEL